MFLEVILSENTLHSETDKSNAAFIKHLEL